MQDDAAGSGDLSDFPDGLDGADLVVGEHHADENRLFRERLFDDGGIDQAVLAHVDVGHLEALLFQALAGVEHGLVLDGRSDDVLALAGVVLGDAFDREVVALRCAAREHDLLAAVGTDHVRDGLAGVFDGGLGFPTKAMRTARCVPEGRREVRQHRLDHAGIDRGRRVIVHVDRKLDTHVLGTQCVCTPTTRSGALSFSGWRSQVGQASTWTFGSQLVSQAPR